MKERDEEMRDKRGMDVQMDSEVAEIIRNSTHASTSKGNAASLLKIGVKRRRTKAEMDAAKLEQETREALRVRQQEIID